jgi:hypothetical protein
MFGVAAFGRIGRRAVRRLSTSARDCPHEVALVGLGCAVAGPVSLAAAAAIVSSASSLELSHLTVVIVLPGVTLLGMVTRLAVRKRPHRWRTAGKRMHSVGAGVVRPGECDELVGVPVHGGITAPQSCLGTLEDRPRPASLPRSLTFRVLASRSV